MVVKLIKNSKAGDRWMKDGKFVKDEAVSEGEKKLYKGECLFCNEQGNRKRLVLGMILPLCDNHYYSEMLGAVVAQARKKGLLNGVN